MGLNDQYKLKSTIKTFFMKKLLSIFSIAAVMTACTTNADKVAAENARLQTFRDSVRLAADTAGLADYRSWKAQREIAMEQDMYNQEPVAIAAAPGAVARRTYAPAPRRTTSTARRSTASRSSGGGSTASTSTNTAQQKRGISKAAKGAIIGGTGGAVAGAVINKKNRAVGAVIGGVLGAGGGYVIGRGKDKKDGRY